MPITEEALKNLFTDPDFDVYSPTEQLNKLKTVDSRFGKMDENGYLAFRTSFGHSYRNLQPSKAKLNLAVPPPPEVKSTRDTLIDYARPAMLGIGTGAAAGAASTGVGIPAAAAIAAITYLNDLGLQGLYSKPNPSILGSSFGTDPNSLSDKTLNTAEQIAINEAGARLFNKGSQAINVISQNLTGTTPIEALKATYSQYAKVPLKNTAKVIEDLFSSGPLFESVFKSKGKAEAQAVSTDLITQSFKKLTGGLVNPEVGATHLARVLDDNFAESILASNKEAEAAKFIAKANPFDIQIPAKTAASNVLNPATGQPFQTQLPADTRTVEGPVWVENSIKWANNYLENYNKSLVDPDPEKKLFQAATKIIGESEAKFDQKTGQLLSHNPIGFDQAWDWKKQASGLGYEGNKLTQVNTVSSEFKGLGDALNSDIDNSLSNWKNNGAQANQSWQNAKSIVSKRISTFQAGDATTDLINLMLDDKTFKKSPVESINKTIDDSHMLQRALNTGALTPETGVKPNVKKLYQNYELMRIMNDAWVPEDASGKIGKYDGKKLIDFWTDPRKQSSRDILFNKADQERIGEFFEAARDVSDKQLSLGPGTKVYMARYGIYMGSTFLAGNVKGAAASMAVGGAWLGAESLGKILTNPTAAMYLTKILKNEPLEASQKFAGRVIMGALNGAVINLVDENNKEKSFKVRKDGELEPVP